jgi:hypothetical protein
MDESRPVRETYETTEPDEVRDYETLGWVVIEEIPAPPAAGGVTYVLGWSGELPPPRP